MFEVVDGNLRDGDDGGTALMWASKDGYTDIVMELLKHEKQVDVNLQDNKWLVQPCCGQFMVQYRPTY